jgi:hypothetical protein
VRFDGRVLGAGTLEADSIQIDGPPSAAADRATMTKKAPAVHATSSRCGRRGRRARHQAMA